MCIQKYFLYLLILFLSFTHQIRGQWTKLPFISNEWLFKVRFVSTETGWILGENHLYKTTNGGITWSKKDSIWHYYSGGFNVIDDSTVIYFDQARGIRKTINNGVNWSTIPDTNFYITDFHFINSRLGFACGGPVNSNDSGTIWKTTNYGYTWEIVLNTYIGRNNIYFKSFSFIDSLHGWVVSYGAKIYRTTDGGLNWIFQDSIKDNQYYLPVRNIKFISSDSGWVVGGIAGNSLIERSTDAGFSWHSLLPAVSDTSIKITYSSIREITMLNSKLGWFTGDFNGPAFLAKTTDGGTTWIDETPGDNLPYGFESISMVNDLIGYVVGYNGSIYKTVNGGITSIKDNITNKIEQFSLSQNYPNPFNPKTVISYQLPVISHVKLKIYDILGNETAILVNEEKQAGNYEVEFNGSNLSSGIYFYSITIEARDGSKSFREVKKMMLLN